MLLLYHTITKNLYKDLLFKLVILSYIFLDTTGLNVTFLQQTFWSVQQRLKGSQRKVKFQSKYSLNSQGNNLKKENNISHRRSL